MTRFSPVTPVNQALNYWGKNEISPHSHLTYRSESLMESSLGIIVFDACGISESDSEQTHVKLDH